MEAKNHECWKSKKNSGVFTEMSAVSIAIIGAGSMATEHIRSLCALDDVKISGIFNRSRKKAEVLSKEYGIKVVASSISELYSRTQADGVIICVAEKATIEICSEASRFPWKILAEKPIGLSAKDTSLMCKVFKEDKKQLFVALNRRFYSSVKSAMEFLTKVQGPRTIMILDQEDPNSALMLGREKEVCANWHFANSIHLIDLFFVFCRGHLTEVRNLISASSILKPSTRHSLLNFDSGDVGIYHAVWNAPGPWALIVETNELRLELRPIEKLLVQKYPSRETKKIAGASIDIEYKPGFLMQSKEFVKALKSETHQLVSIDEYLKSVLLTDDLYKTNGRRAY